MFSAEKIPQILDNELPEIIREIAKQYCIKEYIENPDFLEKRLVKWHQFGLVSHSKRVRKIFLNDLKYFILEKNLYEKIHNNLTEKVNGIAKKTLLEISIPLHDLGKIIVLRDKGLNREHEFHSEKLLYENFLKSKLKSLGLSDQHFRYISKYVKNHDIVGKKIRDKLKSEGNLNLESLSTKEVFEKCRKVASEYSDIKTELGIYYFCDSFGKTDILIDADTNEEIFRQEKNIERTLEKRNLSNHLKYAVMQLPVNIKLAEIYLKSI